MTSWRCQVSQGRETESRSQDTSFIEGALTADGGLIRSSNLATGSRSVSRAVRQSQSLGGWGFLASILVTMAIFGPSKALWADESLRSGSSSAKGCAEFLSQSQTPLIQSLGVVILPEVAEISEVAVHLAESLKMQPYGQISYGQNARTEDLLALRDLFKSLRISNRKFLEFKNAVLERHYLSDSPMVHSDFQLMAQDLENWLDYLFSKYLRDLLLTLDYALRGEGEQFVLSRVAMDQPALAGAPWASQAWVKYSFQDQMHSFYGQFWMVEKELPQQVDGLGFFYLQELHQMLQQVQVAIDGHLKLLPLLVNYSQHMSGLHGAERLRQSEELFVTAGLVHERMEQLLNRVLPVAEGH